MATSSASWLHRKGELASGPWETVIDDSLPDWQYTGLRIAELDGSSADLDAGDIERIIVPLTGSYSVAYIEDDGTASTQELIGRNSVFAGPTDVLFLGAGARATITGTGRVAVAEAPTTEGHPTRYIAHEEVSVDLRGAGRSTRQVHSFGMPGTLDEAARLLVCEVITPSDNWSSYPPHKHDEEIPGHEAVLEEIYYFEAARSSELTSDADAFGVFHTYESGGNSISIDGIVRSGDVALVPHGFHGPAAAAPGYHLYYLNVMAGPGKERAWRAADDPAHAWVRESWADTPTDPRLPFTREAGTGPAR